MNWVGILLGLSLIPAEGPSKAPLVDFQRDVLPILSDRCFACHGPDDSQRGAGLRLDQESKAKAQRKKGTAIAPGKPEKSLLVQRIRSASADEVMPQPRHGKDLSENQKTILESWIAQGAPWAQPWALAPLPSFSGQATIDSLLQRSLQQKGLGLSPPANSLTLFRRIHFDLTGLPPLEKDPGMDIEANYLKKVDELLASDAHAERMASWWLDLVRYADTVGYHGDQDHNASPYRDWVIDAFASNLRFDQFTRMQLAGDLLGLQGDEATDALIASCYNRLLQTSHEGGVQPKEYLAIYQADRVRNLGSVWMGATLACAQCHTHKFDPYTIKDFYQIAAFFADLDEEKHLRGGGGDTIPTKRPPEIKVLTRRDRASLEQTKTQWERAQKESTTSQTTRDTLAREMKRLGEGRLVMISKATTSRPVRVLPRGNWMDDSGELVGPAIPEFLGRYKGSQDRLTRLDLATWLTDPAKGIGHRTARVLANRIWALLFGEGLSPSLEDFGSQGEAPSHPELLDFLADRLIRSGWNVRALIRDIVLSKAYRQSSTETVALRESDPLNRWFARQSSFRLPAEMIRDNALAVSGLLNRKVGGPSFKPYQPEGYYSLLNFPKRGYKASVGSEQYRRGLYIHWQRQFLHPMLRAFDAPSREECTVKRPNSNTPRSALVLLNDPTFLEAALALVQAESVVATETQAVKVDRLFERVVGRKPEPVERAELLGLLEVCRDRFSHHPEEARKLMQAISPGNQANIDPVESASWTFVGRALLNLSETNTRN